MNTQDIYRLRVRIEALQRQSTHLWRSADALEFRNLLPGGRDRRALPSPGTLSAKTKDEVRKKWRLWINMAMKMEGLAHRNRPGSMQRLIDDMTHGRVPF